jgi:hypothetical protein
VIRQLGGCDASLPTGQDFELFLRVSLTGDWLHLTGEPVRFYVGFCETHGEESNLGRKYADRKRRWVRIQERFVFKQHGLRYLKPRIYRRVLAKSWYKAGRDYMLGGRTALAIACLRRSLRYRPFGWKSRLRLAQIGATQFVADQLALRAAGTIRAQDISNGELRVARNSPAT